MCNSSVHVIVLTKNRPETMVRCIRQLELRSCDRLTVLDDSCQQDFRAGRRLLESLWFNGQMSHKSTSELFKALHSFLPEKALKWTLRRANRDIAPLRNLSLLFSYYQAHRITILIDDDIIEHDLDLTREATCQIMKENVYGIAGAYISGTNELGVIERLEHALSELARCNWQWEGNGNVKPLFHTYPTEISHSPVSAEYVSGGYLAFWLPRESLIAFPPGYNEDWLWCLKILLQGSIGIFHLPQLVCHDPPAIRSVTRDDVHFELLGDLVFSLVTQFRAPLLNTETQNPVYLSLPTVNLSISHDIHPMNRVKAVLEQSRICPERDKLLTAGLDVLEQMQSCGNLEIDWIAEISEWYYDAERKSKSFP